MSEARSVDVKKLFNNRVVDPRSGRVEFDLASGVASWHHVPMRDMTVPLGRAPTRTGGPADAHTPNAIGGSNLRARLGSSGPDRVSRPRGRLSIVGARPAGSGPADPSAGARRARVVPRRAVLRGPDSVQQLAVDATRAGHGGVDLTAGADVRQLRPDGRDGRRVGDDRGPGRRLGDGHRPASGRWRRRSPVDGQRFRRRAADQLRQPGRADLHQARAATRGGCHGKASGQNGFRLSLLGFEPALDYETLVKEGRGRRLFPAAPEQSLLLLKATAAVPARRRPEDGARLARVPRRSAAGSPRGCRSARRPTRPSRGSRSTPTRGSCPAGASQQLVVTAHYTDGSTEDVTRWAQYQSNDTEVAAVADGGRVESRELVGPGGGHGPLPGAGRRLPRHGPARPADRRVPRVRRRRTRSTPPRSSSGRRSGSSRPSPAPTPSSSAGPRSTSPARLPTADEIAGVRRRPRPGQAGEAGRPAARPARVRLVLRDQVGRRPPEQARGQGRVPARHVHASTTGSARTWRGTRPTTGSSARSSPPAARPRPSPPVQWYRRLKATDAFVDDTAQVFLGMRLQCAKCHHHPFEKWSQDDYYGFAAFFARVGRKPSLHAQRSGRDDEVIFTARTGLGHAPQDRPGDGPEGARRRRRSRSRHGDDPRQKLVDWMADPKNPFFARAVVNRYWAHFFGRGVVEPMDDLRLTNPPSNPELLDALADDFVKQRLRPQAPGPDDLHEPDLRAVERPERVQRQGQAELRPALPEAAERRGPARRDLAGHGRADGVRRPARRDAGDRAARRERRLDLPRHLRPSQARHALRVRAGERRQPRPEPDAAELERGPGQARRRRRPGRARSPRTRGPTPRRSTSSSGPPSAAPRRAARPPARSTTWPSTPQKRKEAYEDILWALINAKEFQFND